MRSPGWTTRVYGISRRVIGISRSVFSVADIDTLDIRWGVLGDIDMCK